MRLFAKRVRDPEVCFCQNVVEVISGLSQATTNVAWLAIAKRVLTERGLIDIIAKHADNLGGYIVEECYPSDRNVLLNQAEALFEISNSEIDWRSNPSIIVALSRVIKKMGLYDSEKKKLIIKYMYNGENSEINDMCADGLLDMF
jgi:hypothetical protein